jgi:hypothetical protein
MILPVLFQAKLQSGEFVIQSGTIAITFDPVFVFLQ